MTTTLDAIDRAPTPDEIRAAIDRMNASDAFIRSPQLGAFLRFVVEATLHGKASRIKAYTIGIEVLRRDTSFDPQLDPIVRVEATRLRRAIERYYATAGTDDPVIIDLPRGSYVPVFRSRDRARSFGFIGAIARGFRRLNRPWAVAGVASIAVLAVAISIVLIAGRKPPPKPGVIAISKSESPDAAAWASNGMPIVLIEPLRVIGTPQPRDTTAERLSAKISDAFSRFDTINVVPGWVAPAARSTPPAPRSDYRLSGAVEYTDGIANAWFTLTDSAEGNVVWSRNFEKVTSPKDRAVTEDSIVIALTNSLLQSYGVIRSRDRAKQLASNVGDPRYRCVLEAADAIRTADRHTYDLARDCLEQLTAADPSFAVGFTFLALIYNREFQLGYDLRPGDEPPLERALRAVRHSINLHPESSRGYLALMVIQFNRRDIEAAKVAGEKCLALNKYDMLALGEYGGRLILTGNVERGMQMLRDAGAHGAVRPSWHYIYLSIGSYVSGDTANAAEYAGQIADDNVALGQVAVALAAKAAGESERMQKAVDRLLAIQPRWRDDPRGELARLIVDPAIVDRLARDLAAAGLPART